MFTNDKALYTYWAVQFSVQREGLYGLFGPVKVSPQCLPLHALICQMKQEVNCDTQYEKNFVAKEFDE